MRTQLKSNIDIETSAYPDTIIHLISDLIDNPDYETHHWIREILVHMGPKILPLMYRLLDSGNWIIRKEAIKIIEMIGHPSSIPYLIKSLEDSASDIRWIAAEGLIRIGPQVIRPLLKALTANNISYFLKLGAHHVLETMAHQKGSEELRNLVYMLKYRIDTPELIPLEASEILNS